ncbi:RpiB/LacA/LacB family sugar-phosphate isomerase [Nesterenkonia salmonea]|uniref:RpiB/LacA/LacB family sugar-phosphate isomerase n=1 Tax=Nesterenkonia salmonea TaxID=1804987 RepID=A0A5R9B729_9MICC|nr:RpiB/LacA/LacB family sugar-phosphate isomerase [Nesterenkonia salmonea]TLP92700.1 RpiB/LacA/LacB family sugar-phosphate isomerase [Nesterenkonia salmonea]
MSPMRIAVGSDLSGYPLKAVIAEKLTAHRLVSELLDVGADGPEDADAHYAKAATSVAQHVAEGRADRGLLFCGNGLGVTLMANKVEGVDAVTAHDLHSVRTAVSRNGAQVLCMGSEVIAAAAAVELVNEWLATAMPEPDQ